MIKVYIRKGNNTTHMLIGLHGKKGAGKDTLANMIKEELLNSGDRKFQTESFARPIKEFVAMTTGVPVDKLEDRRFKESTLPDVFANPEKGILTYRNLMQVFGTECVRNNIREDYWVRSLLFRIGIMTYPGGGQYYNHTLITDVRFPNEFDALKDNGAYMIHIIRPGQDSGDAHASEQVIDRDFDHVLVNQGSLQDLRVEAMRIAGRILLLWDQLNQIPGQLESSPVGQ